MKNSNTMAILSVICGFSGFFLFSLISLFGLIFGVISLDQFSREEFIRKRGVAVTGIVLSVLFMLFYCLWVASSIMSFSHSQTKGQILEAECIYNQKHFAAGMRMYIEDNDQALPSKTHWCDKLPPYARNIKVFHYPAGFPKVNPIDRRDMTYVKIWVHELDL